MKTTLILFLLLLLTVSLNAQTAIEGDYALIKNMTIKDKTYTVYSKSNANKFQFKIEKKETTEFKNSIDANTFFVFFTSFIKKEFDSTLVASALPDKEKNSITQLIAEIQIVERKKSDAARSEAENLFYKVENEKDQYSALLVLNNSKDVPYKVSECDEDNAKSINKGVSTKPPRKKSKPPFGNITFLNPEDSDSLYPASAQLAMLTKNVNDPILIKYFKIDSLSKSNDYQITLFNDSIYTKHVLKTFRTVDSIETYIPVKQSKKCKKYDKSNLLVGNGKLEILNAKVHFFNNKASSIFIEAELVDNGLKERLIFVNSDYSVPLRYFNKYNSTVSTYSSAVSDDGSRKFITIDYNNIFDYKSDQFFNYSIANSQVSLSNEEPNSNTKQVVQRRFFDFFTAIVYTDIMGFNTENSNSLLNAQAKLLLPLNLRNWRKLTFTRQFTTSANIALNNSFENETRFISIKDDETFSNFDLLRKNNLYGKLNLDVLTYESKGWFLNTSIGYSTSFYRTGFRYTQTQTNDVDIVTNKQVLSLAHGPYLNFEIRPQTNFGADVFISLEDLSYNDDSTINGRNFKDVIITDNERNHFISKYNIASIEANFYWLTSPEKSKGGIYAKLGTYYHIDSYAIFPQFSVGYATNLTSFVNRFKPKKEEKPKTE